LKNKILLISFLSCLGFLLQAQDCSLRLSGYTLDKGTNFPLPYAAIYLEDQKIGTTSDSIGFFELTNLCPAEYHIEFSHIGCEAEHQFLTLSNDTTINIYLNHHAELLDEVVVHGDKAAHSAQVSNAISEEEIAQNSSKNLSDLLENIAGVSVIKNGSGISKPVIHGLYGNRISILNNGIAQAGQQWGNDHAPEIDPFLANHLSVVKGAGALAYGGTSLGGVVLMEVDKIKEDPHLHGRVNYIFQTNGQGHTVNAQLEKMDKWAAWRITGTFKNQGDTQTPDYFLTNTGKREGNFALQLEKKINRWQHHVYYSLFNTTIGILRGAHIGNLTDLQQAIGKDIPFFTNDNFSYTINAPKQEVQHHLLKLESKFLIDDNRILTLRYGGQLNDRKEFDVRRGGASDIPALSIQQFNHFAEATFDKSYTDGSLLKTGYQLNLVDNTNDNQVTGRLPLIPDYQSFKQSAFIIYQKEIDAFLYEIGGRYDWKLLNALPLRKESNGQITFDRFKQTFNNISLSTGAKYRLSKHFRTNLNIGYVLRAPEVNELYSNGLHQGVAGIERGAADLTNEKSFKALLSTDWNIQQKIFAQAVFYYQNIQDYIFLNPQNEFQLDIRGAFPIFQYEQTDATIYGTDLLLSYEPVEAIKLTTKYAFVRGDDNRNNLPLINLPANNLSGNLTYSIKDGRRFHNTSIGINGKYIFKQTHLLTDNSRFPDRGMNSLLQGQDFLAPPPAYFLLGFNVATKIPLAHSSLQFSLSVENVLNTRYRDYLNRLRYFSDEVGRNVNIRVSYGF